MEVMFTTLNKACTVYGSPQGNKNRDGSWTAKGLSSLPVVSPIISLNLHYSSDHTSATPAKVYLSNNILSLQCR